MNQNEPLKNVIHILRATKRWSQEDLAKEVGVSRQTIASLEANKYNPSLLLAQAIADAFEVTIYDVFTNLNNSQGESL